MRDPFSSQSYFSSHFLKRLLPILIIGLSFTAFSQENIDLYVWAGQSNALGRQGDAAQYPADANNLDNSIRLNWTVPNGGNSGGWTTLGPQDLGHYFAAGHFGPEVTFSRRLVQAGNNPAIFKFTQGATSIFEHWQAPGDGGLYDQMVTALNTAITALENQGHTVTVRALVWIQGESDSNSQAAATAYSNNLTTLLNDFRNNVINDADLPIILGVDEQFFNLVDHQQPEILNAHQDIALNDANIKFTSMYGYPKADVTHLTPAGLITHGNDLFNSFQLLIAGSSPTENCTLSSAGNHNSFDRTAWGQSFTTDCSGNLSAITFEAISNHNTTATFRLYNGADCSGTVLVTKTLASISIGDNVVDLAADNLYLDKEHTYYFDIVSDNATVWSIDFSDTNDANNVFGVLRCTSDDGTENCGRTFLDFDMDFSVSLAAGPATSVTCGTGQLQITLNDSGNGISISNILNGATEILNTNITNELFSLDIRNLANGNATATISSTTNWGGTNVALSNGDNDCTITLSNPNLANVPTSLVVTATIHTNGAQSEWDLSVTGLGANHSLMDASYPHLNILGTGGSFLTPQYSGQLFADPANAGINYSGFYPRGNGTNMQFMAYYGASSDIYFGFHDPDAAYKRFLARDENGGVNVECQLPVPDKTLAGNDWDYPGHFELDLFSGDWFAAAMLYKDWASTNADYWPVNDAARQARQAEIGKIGIWFNDIGYYQGNPRTAAQIQNATQICIDEMPDDVPIGTHLYSWNGKPMDKDFPELFPTVINGLETAIATLENNGATIMPYFNGYLYDQGIASYNGTGEPNTAQRIDNGGTYNQTPIDDLMAIMCPATTTWQGILEGAASDVATILNTECIYLDQVAAAAGQQCYNPNHGHTLGGGTYWRDGYKIALQNIHGNANTSAGFFVTTEGACDYLLDEVDGCLVDPWDRGNIVPAYTAVYSGLVQLFGTRVGTDYTSDAFYTQLSQQFSFGIQPGRLTTWIMNDANNPAQAVAKPFAIRLGTMRYKLRDYMAFGDMHHPPSVTPINPATIPTITSDWLDGGGTRMVTISALQTSLWQKGDSIAFVFVNASQTEESLDFSFAINGAAFGLVGDLIIREVTQSSDGTFATINNSSTQTVNLAPLEIKAYIIKAASPLPIEMISFTGYKRNQSVALKWETSIEVNFEGFDIERSADGFHWESIDFVASKDNSLTQKNYQYLDHSPLQGINYYRLKELDKDGQFKYSNTISVQFERGAITIYPNPTHGQISIKPKGIHINKVMIYNQLGQLSFVSEGSDASLDISNLPKGIYTIMVQSKTEVFKQLIVLE